MVALLLASILIYQTIANPTIFSIKSKVRQLRSSEFASEVLKSRMASFVEFYSPNCGHCRTIAPVWESLAKNIGAHVKVVAINCQESGDICGKYQITGVPAMKFFTLSPVSGDRLVLDYNGPRDLKSWTDFAKINSPSYVYLLREKVSDNDLKRYKRFVTWRDLLTKGPKLMKALFLKKETKTSTNPKDLSLAIKSISVEFYGKIIIAQSTFSDPVIKAISAAELLKNIDKTEDTLLLLSPDGQRVLGSKSGKLKFEDLRKLINDHLENGDHQEL